MSESARESDNKLEAYYNRMNRMAPNVEDVPFKAGRPGKDNMRDRAMRYFGHEATMLAKGYNRPEPFSAMSRTPMRIE
jgi:hypothetical protein